MKHPFILLFGLLFWGRLYSQDPQYQSMYTYGDFCDKIRTPDGKYLLVTRYENDQISIFYELDSLGELTVVSGMPKSSWGDTTYFVSNVFEIENGFVVVGFRGKGSGGVLKMRKPFVEKYNWDFQLEKKMSSPKLEEFTVGAMSMINGSEITIVGYPVIHEDNELKIMESDHAFYVLDFEADSIHEIPAAISEDVLPYVTSFQWLLNKFYATLPDAQKAYLKHAPPFAGEENHLIELDFEVGNVEFQNIPGNLFDYSTLGIGGYEFRSGNYQGKPVIIYLGDLPLMNGDYFDVVEQRNELYIYVLNEELSVMHHLRYRDSVYTVPHAISFIGASNDFDFDESTFFLGYTYSNFDDSTNPFTGDTLKNGFVLSEIGTEDGATENLWFVERDSMPIQIEDYWEHRFKSFFRNGESWHFFIETIIDNHNSKGGILTLRKEDLVLGLKEAGREKVIAFPNPFEEKFEIKDFEGEFWVYDINGRLVSNGRLWNENRLVDLGEEKPGLYFLAFLKGKELTYLPLVKK